MADRDARVPAALAGDGGACAATGPAAAAFAALGALGAARAVEVEHLEDRQRALLQQKKTLAREIKVKRQRDQRLLVSMSTPRICAPRRLAPRILCLKKPATRSPKTSSAGPESELETRPPGGLELGPPGGPRYYICIINQLTAASLLDRRAVSFRARISPPRNAFFVVQALAALHWYNYVADQVPADKRILRLNIDETSVCLFQGSGRSNVFVSKKRRVSQHVSRATRRRCMTHVGVICDNTYIQPHLPQVLIGNLATFKAGSMTALRGRAPANVALLRQKSAWNNEAVCAWIVRRIGHALAPYKFQLGPPQGHPWK